MDRILPFYLDKSSSSFPVTMVVAFVLVVLNAIAVGTVVFGVVSGALLAYKWLG